MRPRRSPHEPNHVWDRKTHAVEIDGRTQQAKSCSRCGMERTPDPGTKSLSLFRDMGQERWQAFKSGVLPACEKPERACAS